jgi:hypothetical protein
MQWDTITDQWLWFAAAGSLVVLAAALAYYFYKPKPKAYDTIEDHQDGWTPTGRIDFVDLHSLGNFVLQVEDTRIAESAGGVEHREIRWRKATLEEAKRVIVAYHAQRNLAMTANFVVASPNMLRRRSDVTEPLEAQAGKNETSGEQPKEYEKRDGDPANGLPKASTLTNPA